MNAKHQRIARDIHFTRWLFWAYLFVLFLAPLPLGSNRPLFWALLVAAIGLIALIWSIGWLRGVAHWPHAMRRAKWPLYFLIAFLAWSGVQLLPSAWLPVSIIPAYLGEAFGFVGSPARLTSDVYASVDMLLLSLGLLLLAVMTLILVRSSRRALQVLFVLTAAGLIQALYGSLMVLSGAEFGFLEAKRHGLGVATGTFINRNHYANLLVLSLSAGTGLLLAQMNLAGAQNMRQRLRSLLQALLGPKARLRVYMVIMVIALVLTRSRMGNTAFFAALTLVGFFSIWRLKLPSRPLMLLMVSVLAIDVLVVGTWFGVEQVIDRIQETVQVDEDNSWRIRDQDRLDADREALSMITYAPVAGMGAGSFYSAYPAWRVKDQGFMDHTHNDYLEFVVNYGVVGTALLALFLFYCLHRASQGLENRDREKLFGVSFAAMMAMAAMLIHATVDFSLQIPANAAWFVVLCILPFCMVVDRCNSRTHKAKMNPT